MPIRNQGSKPMRGQTMPHKRRRQILAIGEKLQVTTRIDSNKTGRPYPINISFVYKIYFTIYCMAETEEPMMATFEGF